MPLLHHGPKAKMKISDGNSKMNCIVLYDAFNAMVSSSFTSNLLQKFRLKNFDVISISIGCSDF